MSKKSSYLELLSHIDSSYINLKVYIIFIIALIVLSSYVRYKQYDHWLRHKNIYFVENYPPMTTLDAYYWLRYAKEYKNGIYYKDKYDTLRSYPYKYGKIRPVPMLSFLIAYTSKLTNLNIYKSGLLLIPLLSSLFILPFALYFYYSSMPIAGLIGSFVGTFSWMYFMRTSMGRVDTDLLQLFFIFSSSLFMLFIINSKKITHIFLYFLLSLLFLYVYILWYRHPGIAMVYGVFASLMLIIKTYKDKKAFILSIIIFIALLFIAYKLGYINSLKSQVYIYIAAQLNTNSNVPNILQLISEGRHLSIIQTIYYYTLHSLVIDILGFLAFLAAIPFLRIRIIPLIPTIAMGSIAFFSSVRAIMFLAPFIGVGIGFVIDWFIGYIKQKKGMKNQKILAISISATFIVLLILAPMSAIGYIPKPKIKPEIVKSFIEIKHKIKNAVIVSWWDYGYAIEDICGFATYIDGGSQGHGKTYLIAKGFVGNNQTHLRNIIAFMDRYGSGSIYRNPSILNKILNYNKKIAHNNNYILFTEDMIVKKIGAISYIGNWDFKTKKTKILNFQKLQCNSFKNNILKCNGIRFNFNNGIINNKVKIKKVIFVSNGYIKYEKNFLNNGLIVEVLLKNNKLLYVLLCTDKLFNTNFNQMYILGNYNKKYFEEVYNSYPSARMFKVK